MFNVKNSHTTFLHDDRGRFWFSNKVINHRFKRENVPGLEFLGMGSKLDHIFRILFFAMTAVRQAH